MPVWTRITASPAFYTIMLSAAMSIMAAVPASTASDIAVQSEPIAFDPAAPERVRFGALEWRGGAIVTSDSPDFGGFSGLTVEAGGETLVAVSDAGQWMRARLVYRNGLLNGLADVRLEWIQGAPGERLKGKTQRDSEGLAMTADGDALIVFERRHRLARYDFSARGTAARADYLDLPAEKADFSPNKGLEAVGQFGTDTSFAGAILVIAERYLDDRGNHSGWLLFADRKERITIERSAEFDITDLAILPDGGVVLLERRFSLLFGPAIRLRLIALQELTSGAPVKGRILLTAKDDKTLDNMEGLSIHTGSSGETLLTLISDNNFRGFQRTIIMQFALQTD